MLAVLLDRIPHETIHVEGEPYLTRYYLTGRGETRWCKSLTVFLHHFHKSDDRHLHNHPWPGLSFILSGGYLEERCEEQGTTSCPAVFTQITTHVCKPLTFNRLGLQDFHRAQLLDETKGCWTLFFAGKKTKGWGFMNRDTKAFRAHRMNDEDE